MRERAALRGRPFYVTPPPACRGEPMWSLSVASPTSFQGHAIAGLNHLASFKLGGAHNPLLPSRDRPTRLVRLAKLSGKAPLSWLPWSASSARRPRLPT